MVIEYSSSKQNQYQLEFMSNSQKLLLQHVASRDSLSIWPYSGALSENVRKVTDFHNTGNALCLDVIEERRLRDQVLPP